MAKGQIPYFANEHKQHPCVSGYSNCTQPSTKLSNAVGSWRMLLVLRLPRADLCRAGGVAGMAKTPPGDLLRNASQSPRESGPPEVGAQREQCKRQMAVGRLDLVPRKATLDDVQHTCSLPGSHTIFNKCTWSIRAAWSSLHFGVWAQIWRLPNNCLCSVLNRCSAS